MAGDLPNPERIDLDDAYLDLAGIIARLEDENPDRVLPIGFARPHSYRGIYADLAFEPFTNITIREMLTAAREALGSTYHGYKGGDYTMSGSAECWIANYGCSGDNKIGPLLLELLLAQPAPRAATPAAQRPGEAGTKTLLKRTASMSSDLPEGQQSKGSSRRPPLVGPLEVEADGPSLPSMGRPAGKVKIFTEDAWAAEVARVRADVAEDLWREAQRLRDEDWPAKVGIEYVEGFEAAVAWIERQTPRRPAESVVEAPTPISAPSDVAAPRDGISDRDFADLNAAVAECRALPEDEGTRHEQS